MFWKEFLNYCRARDYQVSNEKEIPYGKKVEIRHGQEKAIVNHFTSGKYSIQGKEGALKASLEGLLGIKTKTKKADGKSSDYQNYAGSDESGKGDYFGPLVVAACFVPDYKAKELESLGVQDSKKIKDQKILELASQIQKSCHSEVILLQPEEYNFIYENEKNLNHILVEMHHKVHKKLFKKELGIEGIVIDQFTSHDHLLKKALASLKVEVLQKTGGEKYLPVACASILARARFVKEMEALSKKWKMDFPKGASLAVEETAKEFLSNHGKEALQKVAKLHFATSQKIGFTEDEL